MDINTNFSCSGLIPSRLAGKWFGVDQIEINDYFSIIIAKFPVLMFRKLYFPQAGVTTLVFAFFGIIFNLKMWFK